MADLMNTYDACDFAVGLGDAEKALLPIGHLLMKTHICVTIDGDGHFIRAEAAELKVITPVTEDAESRTSAVCAYPLFDGLGYVSPDYNLDKYNAYINSLRSFAVGNRKLEALLKYVMGGTILGDLNDSGVKIKRDKNSGIPDEGQVVRFAVELPGDPCEELWKDGEIRQRWTDFCLTGNEKNNSMEQLCYVSGEMSANLAEKHPKNINGMAGNSKLISANDKTNYVWRGRFTETAQALTVSYAASQKAHQALRWLIKNIAFKCGTQAIVAFEVGEFETKANEADAEEDFIPKEAEFNPFEVNRAYYETEEKSDSEKLASTAVKINRPYAQKVRNAIAGLGDIRGAKHTQPVDVLAVDSPVTGRLSVTFFERLTKDKYLDSVAQWHETCAWYIPFSYKNDDGKYIGAMFCGAPSTDDIVAAVHGVQTGESYDRLKKFERIRLLHCVFRKEHLPGDMVTAAVSRASKPEAFDDEWAWRKVLSVACAMVRKYYYDKEKELYDYMELNNDCRDRSFLWGRLLACAEDVESKARYFQDKNNTDKRPTNALRYMSAFRAHPLRSWTTIMAQLQPYLMMLPGREWCLRQIDEITSLFEFDGFDDKPLDGRYLMGYSLQRMAIYNRNKNDKNNKSEDNDNEFAK
jgi:CRISPR-associated protein Csd1